MDNALSIIGFLFTLISLLGSFFYIQLSDWFRDVLELNKKYSLNKSAANVDMKNALRECRYEYRKLFNFVPVITTFAISGFLAYISKISFKLLSKIEESGVKEILNEALIVFLGIYIVLILTFTIGGIFYAIVLKKVND